MATRKTTDEPTPEEITEQQMAAAEVGASPMPPSGGQGMDPGPQVWDTNKTRKQNEEALRSS